MGTWDDLSIRSTAPSPCMPIVAQIKSNSPALSRSSSPSRTGPPSVSPPGASATAAGGHLQPRRSGRAAFSPKEVVEIRLMTELRKMERSLVGSRADALRAAPNVLYYALSESPKSCVVEADSATIEEFDKLFGEDKSLFSQMARLRLKRITRMERWTREDSYLTSTLGEENFEPGSTSVRIVIFKSLASEICGRLMKPFYYMIPKSSPTHR